MCAAGDQGAAREAPAPSRKRDAPDEPASVADDDELSALPLSGDDVGPVEAVAALIEAVRDGAMDRLASRVGFAPSLLREHLTLAFMLSGSGHVQVRLNTLRKPALRRYVPLDGIYSLPGMQTMRYLEGDALIALGTALRG